MITTSLFANHVEPMMKRLFLTLSPDITSRSLLRLDWIEALQTPGCALCIMAQRKSQRYVETLLSEADRRISNFTRRLEDQAGDLSAGSDPPPSPPSRF